MRQTLVRPEQTQSPAHRFPLFADAGRRAADLWMQFAPLTAAEFRDLRFRNLVAGFGYISDFDACRSAFHDAFASAVARGIAAISRGEVSHG